MTRPPLAVGLAHRWYVVVLCGQARVITDLLVQRIQEGILGAASVGILGAASVLLTGVGVITVRVDNVPIATARRRAGITSLRPAGMRAAALPGY